MASRSALHPWGPWYFLLLLGAWALRLPALFGFWLTKKKITDSLKTTGVTRNRIQVPSRDAGRTIEVDLYESANQSKHAKRNVHLNAHGSGFVVPSLGTDIDFCASVAATGIVVFDADYRKAPEYPFPAAYHDIQDVLTYIRNHDSDFDVAHLTASGFSAGANLVMSLAVNSQPGTIAGLVSIYGNTDMTTVYSAPNVKEFDSGAVLPNWLRRFFYMCYILPDQDRADTRLSPAKAALDRWPRHVFMACGTADSLHEASRVMIDRLRTAGHKDVEFMSVKREAHAFDKSVGDGSPTEEKKAAVYQKAIELIRRAQKDA